MPPRRRLEWPPPPLLRPRERPLQSVALLLLPSTNRAASVRRDGPDKPPQAEIRPCRLPPGQTASRAASECHICKAPVILLGAASTSSPYDLRAVPTPRRPTDRAHPGSGLVQD